MPHRTSILRKPLSAIARRMMGTITHVSTQEPLVALTFDDGPHPESTPRLLQILEKHGARATFFMVGEAAHQYPDLVRRVAQAGHAIGNHSWDHPSFPLLSGMERRSQIRACERALTPYGQRLFRPPYGHQSLASRFDALLLGYQVVAWNLHAYDWQDHDTSRMVGRLVDGLQPGRVVLLHDTLYTSANEQCADREALLEAVDALLERSVDRFRFITIPNLLRRGRPQRSNWYMKPDPAWLNSRPKKPRQHADITRA